VTHLRQLMLDELQRRNSSPSTTRCCIHAVEDFSKYFHRSPERLGPSHIREYQVHLFRDRKLSPGTIQSRCAALRFLFVKTLRRPYLLDENPFSKRPRKLPTVLSPEEVARLIDSAQNLMHRAMLMTLYATGLRRAELCHLKVTDIDSERMVIHVHQGKGSRDRDVRRSSELRTCLDQYPYSVLSACAGSTDAARHAGINPATHAAASNVPTATAPPLTVVISYSCDFTSVIP
jgi:integrase/recombinase XerD